MNERNDEAMGGQEKGKKGRSWRRFLVGLLAGTLLGGVAAGAVSVYSHMGPGRWFHGGPGCHRLHSGPVDPEMMAKRVDFVVGWVLSQVNGSEEQRQRVKAVLQQGLTDLWPVRDQHLQNRQAMVDLLGQTTIDREALERIRAAEMQLAETASRRLVEAVADIADALTPEQRLQLIDWADRFRR